MATNFSFSGSTAYTPPLQNAVNFEFTPEGVFRVSSSVSFNPVIQVVTSQASRLPASVSFSPVVTVDARLFQPDVTTSAPVSFNPVIQTRAGFALLTDAYLPAPIWTSDLRNAPLNRLVPDNYSPITFNIGEQAGFSAPTFAGFAPVTVTTFPLTPISTTRPAYRLGGINDIFYNRIIVEPGVIELGTVSSQLTRTISVFNAFFVESTLNSIQATDTGGITINPNVSPRTFDPLEEQTYTLTVSTNGPPTINGSYRFTFAEGVGTVAVRGSRTTAFPYLLRPGATETLIWQNQLDTFHRRF